MDFENTWSSKTEYEPKRGNIVFNITKRAENKRTEIYVWEFDDGSFSIDVETSVKDGKKTISNEKEVRITNDELCDLILNGFENM